MKRMTKWLRKASWLILALALALSTLTACSGEDVGEILDIAIEVLDAIETAEDDAQIQDIETSESKSDAQITENSTTEDASSEETTSEASATTEVSKEDPTQATEDQEPKLDPDGWYSTKEEVALYIHLYGKLPGNYITKNKAKDLGWESSKGNLWDVAHGKSIGGDRYYNNDDQLPEVKGRKYYECDINYNGGYRGGERIVFSNDGLIYYTGNHYNSFELLYGGE